MRMNIGKFHGMPQRQEKILIPNISTHFHTFSWILRCLPSVLNNKLPVWVRRAMNKLTGGQFGRMFRLLVEVLPSLPISRQGKKLLEYTCFITQAGRVSCLFCNLMLINESIFFHFVFFYPFFACMTVQYVLQYAYIFIFIFIL